MSHEIVLQESSWIGFVFCQSQEPGEFLRVFAKQLLEARYRTFLSNIVDAPSELINVFQLLSRTDVGAAGCTWIQALDTAGNAEHWYMGWEQLLLRLNERRDSLRRELSGGLVFAMSASLKQLVRDAAPDLWSVRTLVLEPGRVTIKSAAPPRPKIRGTMLVSPPPPKFLVARLRPERSPNQTSLENIPPVKVEDKLVSAMGLIERGSLTEALDALTLPTLLTSSPSGVRALLLRAQVRRQLAMTTGANEDIGAAIAAAEGLVSRYSSDSEIVGLLVHALIASADLHFDDDMPTARAALAQALQVVRADEEKQSRAFLEFELLILQRLGDAAVANGELDAAGDHFKAAGNVAARLNEYEESPTALRGLSIVHTRLGNIFLSKEAYEDARREFTTAAQLRQRAIDIFGASPERLADLRSVREKLDYLARLDPSV